MQLFVAACLLACAAAFPQGQFEGSGEPPALRSGLNDVGILRSDFDMSEDGSFQYGFESTDGTVVDAAGEQRQIGNSAGIVMRGSYSYVSPEGNNIAISWVADESGFRAEGDSIPAVPEYVSTLLKNLPAAPAPALLSTVRTAPLAPVRQEVVAAPESVVEEELLTVVSADEPQQEEEQEVFVLPTVDEQIFDSQPEEVAVEVPVEVVQDVGADAQPEEVVADAVEVPALDALPEIPELPVFDALPEDVEEQVEVVAAELAAESELPSLLSVEESLSDGVPVLLL
ncbi:uncharacterized protein LOC119093424 [Pollicipes pollicipes]|uniref:uncharacterized protein LOC119093424 n=1 Tax=Pollicipes pollicipes TaxID=41117 RepID=UPI001884A309|nr:uncharacterized protein LOC119093424 [Pollicipes pollicipes]